MTILKKARILIVDDNENMLETLNDILQEQGYDTDIAKTGKEALAKAEKNSFNIAIIDIMLPDTTGLTLLQTFRRRYPKRKNIIVTAYATLHNTMDALNKGANAYILKPLDPNKLEQTLKQCLEEQKNIEKSIDEIKRELDEKRLIRRAYERF